MAENTDEIKKILQTFTDIVNNLDNKQKTSEKLQIQIFSYLYNKLESDYSKLNVSSDISEIRNSINILENKINNISEYLENNKSEKQIKTPVKKKRKRKRPIFWCIRKQFVYKKLMEEKQNFYKELEIIKEQERIEKEKQRKIEEEKRRKKQEESNKKIKEILGNINKGAK